MAHEVAVRMTRQPIQSRAKRCAVLTMWLTALLVVSKGAQTVSAADRPNVVLVMCDDLGWGDVGFNGNTVIQTPHLDQMANAGLKFDRFYAAAPVCSPTRASVLTGRHPFRYGIYNANTGHIKGQEITLAELLRKLGYRTGHFGKWHVGTLTKTQKDANRGGSKGVQHYAPPQDNGFDVCFSTESKVPTFDPLIKPAKPSRTHWAAITDRSKAKDYGTAYWDQNGDAVTDNTDGDDSRVIMDRAVPFIEEAAKAKEPFFAIIWFHTPHLPVVASAKHAAMYKQYDEYSQQYFGCITAMDEQIGRLRKTLRDVDADANTIVTFCSDNGPEGSKRATPDSSGGPGSAGPFRGRKRDLFEGGIRVPGLIEWPARIKPATVTDYPAVSSDYLPTILEAVGIEFPDQRPIDGISLLPVFDNSISQRPAPIGFQSKGKAALIDNQFKLIRYQKGATEGNSRKGTKHSGNFMLFDMQRDKSEQQDVAKQHPDIVKKMSTQLEEWQASCKASDQGKDYK